MYETHESKFGKVHAVKTAPDSTAMLIAARESLRNFKSAEPADASDPELQQVPAKFRSIVLQSANRAYEASADTARLNVHKVYNAHFRALVNSLNVEEITFRIAEPDKLEEILQLAEKLKSLVVLPQK